MRIVPVVLLLGLSLAACPIEPEEFIENGDCTPYDPTTANDGVAESWANVDEASSSGAPVDIYTITAPSDPGGGVFRVILRNSSGVVPAMVIQAVGDETGAIIAASAPPNDSETKSAKFAAAPGQSYTIEARQFDPTIGEQYPVDYTLTWTFESMLDCFEPNDSAQQAKAVVMDEVIKAKAFTGYKTNYLTSDAYLDWYKFTVDEASTVSAELQVAPGSQHRMRIRFWAEDGTTELANSSGNAGGELFTTEATLDPGSYLMSVETADPHETTAEDQDVEPEHWGTAYEISLTATPS